MKCVVAMMQHETNTFSPLESPLEIFGSSVGLLEPPSAQQAIDIYGYTDFAFAGLLNVAKEQGAEIVVPIAAYAEPSGKVEDEAVEWMCEKICYEVAQGCDALLLDLHGAMVTQSYNDGEGELLKRIRAISPDLPIAVALDLHANLTEDMVHNSTVIDGYRTYPHTDMYLTGQRAAESLFTIINGQLTTKMCWKSLPMMTHMLKQTPLQQPMKDIMERVIHGTEAGYLLNASVFAGFPLADIPHVSLSVLTLEVCNELRYQQYGEDLIKEVCDMAWQRRAEFVFEAEALSDSIKYAKFLRDFPIVIADHGDNSGAGGSTDDLTVLDEMLSQGLDGIIAGPIWDPEAVQKLISAGRGSELSLSIGGKIAVPAINQQGYSIHCRGIVSNITDGRFVIEGPMQTGLCVNLGRTVVFDIGAAKILLSEQRWEPYDPGCFIQAGLNPLEEKYILIKSRQHFRATFEAIAKHIILAAGPGVCSSDYSQFTFKSLTRPIYPLDLDTEKPDFSVEAIRRKVTQ